MIFTEPTGMFQADDRKIQKFYLSKEQNLF